MRSIAPLLLLALALNSGCVEGILESADCCACLLMYDEQGIEQTPLEATDPIANCIPGERSFNQGNSMCSTQMSEQLVNGVGATEVTAMACVESVCAAECAAVRELGIRFEAPEPGGELDPPPLDEDGHEDEPVPAL